MIGFNAARAMGVVGLVLLGACGDDSKDDGTVEATTSTLPGDACTLLGSMVDLTGTIDIWSTDRERPDPFEVTVADLVNLGFLRVTPAPAAWSTFDAYVFLDDGVDLARAVEVLEADVPGPRYVAVDTDAYIAEFEAAYADRPRLLEALDFEGFNGRYVRIADATEAQLAEITAISDTSELGDFQRVSALLDALDRMAPAQLPQFLALIAPHL